MFSLWLFQLFYKNIYNYTCGLRYISIGQHCSKTITTSKLVSKLQYSQALLFFFFFFCARKILLNLYFSHGSFPLSVSQLHVVSNLSFSVCRQDSPTMQATPLHSPHLCNLIFISYHAAYVLAKQMFCQFHISVLYSCSFPQQSFFKFHHFSSLCSFYFFKECI